MGQMASLLAERQSGSLPSNSEVNPRGEGKEYCKAITLRSGRELEIKEHDQIIPKDHMQGEQPRDMRVSNDNENQNQSEQSRLLLTRPKRIHKFNCTITKGLLYNPRKLHHKTC